MDEELAAPDPRHKKPAIAQIKVLCFQCETELDVPAAAESTMCKRCSSHVDLRDYVITQTVSKNFRTHGRLVVEEKGYVLNTDSLVGDAVVKGRLIGKISARRSLELHSTAQIKGTFITGKLIVPVGQHFRWAEPLKLGGADIGGELVATLHSTGTVFLRAASRFFGTIHTRHLVMESGAVLVGEVEIRPEEAVATEGLGKTAKPRAGKASSVARSALESE
jgi:cytoskeletal protein CcmA (bactofilin family)